MIIINEKINVIINDKINNEGKGPLPLIAFSCEPRLLVSEKANSN